MLPYVPPSNENEQLSGFTGESKTLLLPQSHDV